MLNFKAGDKVWVKPLNLIKNNTGLASSMKEFCGMNAEVVRFDEGFYVLRGQPDIYGWYWREEWLESDLEHEERIRPKAKFSVGQIVYLKPKEEVSEEERQWIGEGIYEDFLNAPFKVTKVCVTHQKYNINGENDNGIGCFIRFADESSLETEKEHCARVPVTIKKVVGEKEVSEKHVRFEDLPEKDQKALMEMIKRVDTVFKVKREVTEMNYTPKRVIFNSPATIVFWKDGSKTVASAHNEAYDPEKGLAVCFAKKALGNGYEGSTAFMKLVKKWLPKKTEEDDEKPTIDPAVELVEKLNQMEKDGIVLSRAKIYRFDNGSVVKYHKKIESWVHSIDKKA